MVLFGTVSGGIGAELRSTREYHKSETKCSKYKNNNEQIGGSRI